MIRKLFLGRRLAASCAAGLVVKVCCRRSSLAQLRLWGCKRKTLKPLTLRTAVPLASEL